MKDDTERELAWERLASIYIWDMTGYEPKCGFSIHDKGLTMSEARNAFQLIPPPPTAEDINEYIVNAQNEKELRCFSFFLHCYENTLNKRISYFLLNEGYGYNPETFLDFKLSCASLMLERLIDYDSTQSAFKTFIHWSVRDALLLQRICEGAGSYSSLAFYKKTRKLAWRYNNLGKSKQETAADYSAEMSRADGKKCSVSAAMKYLDIAIMSRSRIPFYVSGRDGDDSIEDVTQDDSWNYTEIIDDGIPAAEIRAAFEKLDYREQTLIEKRNAICMTCGRVSSLRKRESFEALAVMFEGSGASGAMRAYRKALDSMTLSLLKAGKINAVRIRRKKQTKSKNTIISSVYTYLADDEGEWGEFSVDFTKGTFEIIKLADGDTTMAHIYAKHAINYLLSEPHSTLPKEALLALRRDYRETCWF